MPKINLLIFFLMLGLSWPVNSETLPDFQPIERTITQGNYSIAEQQLRQALSRFPNDPSLLNLQARLKLNQGFIEEAISVYQGIKLPENPSEQLLILNNYWLTLDYQQKLLEKQLFFLQRDSNLILPDVQAQLEAVKAQKQQLMQMALFLANSLPPSVSVAQVYLNGREWQKAKLTLRSLPSGTQKTFLLVKLQDKGLLEQELSQVEGHDKLAILTALASLDPRYLSPAIELGLQLGNDELLFQLFALQAQKEISPKGSYRAAIASLSRLRPALTAPNPQTKLFFENKVIPVYRGYLEILLENPDQADLKEARDIFERLQIAQVENLLNQLCLTSSQSKIEEQLSQINAAIIHTIVLPKATHLLVTLPSGEIRHHRVAQTEQEMVTLTLRWRDQLKDPAFRRYFEDAAQLYSLMIEPIKDSLLGVDQLIFVSDGTFRTIPPSAFFDPQSQQFLIEQVGAIRSLLSSAFLQDISVEFSNLLAFGLSESRPPFNTPLPYVESELELINQVIPNSVVLINDRFTVDSLRRDLLTQDPHILHIASHAQFTGNPRTSLVATYQDTLNLFELESLLSLESSLDLLVLSACETSSGDNLSTLGLAGMAVQANVKSVIGTLWKVNDQSSQALIRDFYQGLSEGKSVAIALADAQRKAIRRDASSSDWALMLLLG